MGVLPAGAPTGPGGPGGLHTLFGARCDHTFRHLLFHLALSHSGWSYGEVCFGETFAALVKGLQGALWELGGVPRVMRTDNLSAATHELRDSRGRAVNASYEAVLAHYGVEATRTNPRSSHENGVVEQRHRREERDPPGADPQGQSRLRVRGGVQDVRQTSRRPAQQAGEFPESSASSSSGAAPAPVPEYVNYRARVRRWSTIRVANRTYSVPSRLIGMVVDVRLYADHIEVYYKGHLVESMERVHGTGEAQIDYRHIIGSLVRKPGAFARYRFREQNTDVQAGVRRAVEANVPTSST